MTFDEWLEHEGIGSDSIELKLKRAWTAAKADCALDCRFRYAIGEIRAVIRDIDEDYDEFVSMADINAICDEVWRAP